MRIGARPAVLLQEDFASKGEKRVYPDCDPKDHVCAALYPEERSAKNGWQILLPEQEGLGAADLENLRTRVREKTLTPSAQIQDRIPYVVPGTALYPVFETYPSIDLLPRTSTSALLPAPNMRRISLLILMALIFPGRTEAAAAPRVADLCISAVHTALAREQRIYRTVILGLPHAKDVPPGSSRYDKEGRAWIKMKINDWRSEDLPNENRADEEMDTNAGEIRSERRRSAGEFWKQKVLTSELIRR